MGSEEVDVDWAAVVNSTGTVLLRNIAKNCMTKLKSNSHAPVAVESKPRILVLLYEARTHHHFLRNFNLVHNPILDTVHACFHLLGVGAPLLYYSILNAIYNSNHH